MINMVIRKVCINCEELKLLNELSDKICEVLNVNWNDRQNMKNLFVSCLKKDVAEHNKGLLFQYEQYLFDKAIERLKKEIGINAEINYNNALHARLADIVDEIKKKDVLQKETVPTHKEFQKAVDKAGLRGYEFKDEDQKDGE